MIARLKGVQRIVTKGRVYYYHRQTKTRIKAAYGTAEFVAEVTRLNAALEKATPTPNTVDALIAAYRASPEFQGLAARTKKDYQRVMDWLAPIGKVELSRITPSVCVGLRDKAFQQHKRRFANYVVDVGSIIFQWGVPREITAVNPFAPVQKVRKPHGEAKVNRVWMPQELETVIEAAPPGIRAAIALGAYAGLREGDALRLPWSAWDGEAISYTQAKTGRALRIRTHKSLNAILADTPRNSPVLVTGQRKKPLTESGFRAMFFRLLGELEQAGRVGGGLTFHGLRHTAATMLAEAGCDDRDIMAVTGHKTVASVQRYTQEADQNRRSVTAVTRLEKAQSRNQVCKTRPGKV